MTDPNWYPDPTGRFEVRYFDGAQWTEHVATAGASATDPMPNVQETVAVSNPTPAPSVDQGHQTQGPLHQAGPPPGFDSYPTQEGWPGTESSPGPSKGVVGLLAVLAAVVVLVVVGAFLLLSGGEDGDGDTVEALAGSEPDSSSDTDEGETDDATTSSTTTAPSSSTTAPTTTRAPTTTTAAPTPGLPAATDPRVVIPEYGSDPDLDRLADDCQAGDMRSCDSLFFDSPLDSGYEDYGDSCGGRNRPAGFCVGIYAE